MTLTNCGFSHVGLSTHRMDATIQFYEGVLGLSRVADNLTRIKQGGTLRQVYFDAGDGQFIVFMEPRNIPGIRDDYDTGINGALGVPGGMYHFALKVGSLEELDARRTHLEGLGVSPSAIIDLGHAHSVFFRDPNGIQLELCWHVRAFEQADLYQESEASLAPTK